MKATDVSELLGHAADSVSPAETDPATRLAGLGRRSVRRRRAWGSAGVAAVVAAVVAVPFAGGIVNRPPDELLPAQTVTFGGMTVDVPAGWRTSRVPAFDQCLVVPRTVYLAESTGAFGRPPDSPGAGGSSTCTGEGQEWIAIVRTGTIQTLTPVRLEVENRQLIDVRQETEYRWTYKTFATDPDGPAVIVSGDQRLRELVSWPPGPPVPASGGLAMPDPLTDALGEDPMMVTAMDAETLGRIEAKLGELRDQVPVGEECVLEQPGPIAIALGGGGIGLGVTVVLGDEECPQAVSTGGGRVRVPPGLGSELLELIKESERDAAQGGPGG